MKKFFTKLSNSLFYLFKKLNLVLLIMLTILTFSGVIARYVFNNPIVWVYEITLILFSWLVFSGVSVAFKTGENICVDLFKNKSKKNGMIFAVIGNLSTLIFLVCAIKNGITIIINTSAQQYNTVAISTAWFYVPLPLCGLVSLIHMISSFLEGRNPLQSIIKNQEEVKI